MLFLCAPINDRYRFKVAPEDTAKITNIIFINHQR